MKKTLSIALLLSMGFSLFLVSCASVGNSFDYNSINNLEPGDSEQEVIDTLGGQPCTRTYNDDETYDLTWKYVHGNMLGAKGFVLIIRFSKDGKMLKIVKQGTNKAGF